MRRVEKPCSGDSPADGSTRDSASRCSRSSYAEQVLDELFHPIRRRLDGREVFRASRLVVQLQAAVDDRQGPQIERGYQ